MISPELIEEKLTKHLQKKVDFVLDNKTIKSGKIMLFCIKDFFCTFTLYSQEKKKKIIYEIPYPFNASFQDESVMFDYTIETFSKGRNDILPLINSLRTSKSCKLLNKKLTLKIYI